MDDVSKLQQINNIARELLKHGQANSMEEATRLATQQVESGQMAPPPMPEAPSPEAAPAAEPLPEVPEQAEMPGDDMTTDDKLRVVEEIVEKQQTAVSRMTTAANAHTRQINELNGKINMLITEMASLKQEVDRLRNSPVTPPLPKKEASQGQTQFKQETKPAQEQKKPDGSGHVRSGNYNPEDVSIEKFFYYGK